MALALAMAVAGCNSGANERGGREAADVGSRSSESASGGTEEQPKQEVPVETVKIQVLTRDGSETTRVTNFEAVAASLNKELHYNVPGGNV